MIRMCCVCHRVDRGGEWTPAALPAGDELVTHGYCPDCFVGALAEVEELTGSLAARPLAAPEWPTMRGGWN